MSGVLILRYTPGGLAAAAALLFFLCGAGTAGAHHILGLPHYSYKDSYPQAPVLEYPAKAGPYDILLTSYPGQPVPGEAATLAFYIKDRHTGVPMDQDIRVRVYRDEGFGKVEEVLPPTVTPAYEVPHKVTVTFPRDGSFTVELTLPVEGRDEVISFVMVAGEPGVAPGPLVLFVAGLILFVVVIRAIKIKRRRRRLEGTMAVA